VRGLTLYHVDWETQLHLCLLGNPGFAVLGAIVGGIVAWRPRGGRGLFTGVAGGVGVGVLAALLLSTVPGNTIVVHPAVVVCRAYAFIGFIIIGSLLRMLLLTGPKRHWFWAALPTLLLWGPALGLVSSRTVFRPQERLVGDPNLDSLTIEPHPGAGLGFRYSHGGAGDGGAYKHKKVGESGSVFSAEEYPNSLSVALVWPAPAAAFEVTVDFDPGDSPHRLWVNVFGFFGTQATLDQEVVSLPVTLPPGKHRLVIKALYH
jgi:hypothetical protein